MKFYKSIFLIISIAAFCIGCKRNGTSWDTNWTAPIAYGTLDLNDLVQDSVFAVNPDSTLQLIYKTKIVDLDFDSLFKIPDTTIQEKIALAITLEVPPGMSFLNQVDEREFDIENAQIKELQIKSGKAVVTVFNPIETGIYLTITLPGVVKQGQDLTTTAFVEAGTLSNPTPFNMEVDFTGYTMDLRGSSGNSWNTLQSIFEVQSDPNGDSVTVTNLDSIQIDVAFQNLIPDYGKGYFGNRILGGLDTVNLDFMKNFVDGAFLLDQVNLDLNIVNGVVVTATGIVNSLTSTNTSNSNTVNLSHQIIGQNININPATGSWNNLNPFVYPININSSNSNINAFIENLPDVLIMDYDIEINPLGNISGGNDIFYPLSEMSVEIDLNMPTRFSVEHLKFIDTMDIAFEQNPESTRITHGELKLKSENLFPFSLDADLVFLDEMGAPIDTLFSNSFIQAGIPDVSGKVITPEQSEVIYLVDQDFMYVIENASRVIILAHIDNSNHPISYDLYDYYTIELKITSNIGLQVNL
jgi:hypothetical protein